MFEAREQRLNGDDNDGRDYVEIDPSGRYGRFSEVLGKGAMKTVYRAFDELRGVEVAWNQAKICDVLRSPEALERLYSEVHLLSTLSHDSIIQFHAFWVDEEKRTFNFITELFTSGTLREYRQRYRRVDIRAVKNWARQILHGLIYLHSHDPPVIHRDLKCDNIFVNGHLGQVKIGDLGLAAVLKGTQPARSVIGTPEFMAPELYEEEYNELVDIYSFGMCVLEMFTAEYPYSECSNPAQIYKKVTSGKLPDAFYRVQDQEAWLFIGKCLENASKRSSAKELLLDPFLQPEDADPAVNLYGGFCKATSGTQAYPHLQVARQHKTMRSSDMKITGKMNSDDDAIYLRVQIADKDGHVKNIYFPFDINSDTSMDVANEMVKELEITDRDPSQIARVIDQEISALVPHWKEGGAADIYAYDDEDEGIHHPFYYLSSPTSSQGSYVSRTSRNARYHQSSAHHAQNSHQDETTFPNDDDDDNSSQCSIYSGRYSFANYSSSGEQDPEPSSRRESQHFPHNQKSSRFCPEENARIDPSFTTQFNKQCSMLAEPSQSSNRGVRRSSDGRRLTRNRSLVDIRSQLLHKTLVEEVNKRLFKTVGAVEQIGFQHPCEASSSKGKKSCHGAHKKSGFT